MAMTLRLTDEQSAALRETAQREGLSMHATALKAIDAYVAPRIARRDALLAEIVKEDAAVLERLKDA